MPKKLMQTVRMGSITIKVHYDYYWQEYQVSIVGQPKSTYYTNDRVDALDTAKAMGSRANLAAWEPSTCH